VVRTSTLRVHSRVGQQQNKPAGRIFEELPSTVQLESLVRFNSNHRTKTI
jgi:hypothetical protein